MSEIDKGREVEQQMIRNALAEIAGLEDAIEVITQNNRAAIRAEREQVLADATARIEGLRKEPDPTAHHTHNAAIDAALAALNQPQTEKEA